MSFLPPRILVVTGVRGLDAKFEHGETTTTNTDRCAK